MRESHFVSEVMRSLKKFGVWAYKIGDMPRFQLMRFQQNKPFDIVACNSYGQFVAIECKQIKKWKPFGMKEMRPNQIESLDAISRFEKAIPLVFLNIRIPADRSKKQKRENRLIIMPWKYLKEKIRFSKKDLQQHEYVDGSKGYFDLMAWGP